MISFVIPAYNEELELSATIAAIHAATSGAAQPCEVIVVDDASTDATARIASHAGAKVIPIDRRSGSRLLRWWRARGGRWIRSSVGTHSLARVLCALLWTQSRCRRFSFHQSTQFRHGRWVR